ncbi:hypothetical protein [Streptomyces sp. enrichment culture]
MTSHYVREPYEGQAGGAPLAALVGNVEAAGVIGGTRGRAVAGPPVGDGHGGGGHGGGGHAGGGHGGGGAAG